MVARNIGGARAPVPPFSYDPVSHSLGTNSCEKVKQITDIMQEHLQLLFMIIFVVYVPRRSQENKAVSQYD